MTVVISTLADDVLLNTLRDVLAEWQPLADAGVTVEVCEPVNESPENCPWVGLYPSRTTLTPRAIGLGPGFRKEQHTIAIVMNASSSESGADCRGRMATLVKGVADALCTDGSVRGLVDVAEEMDVTYSSYAQTENAFFQTAVAAVTFTTQVQAAIV